MFFKKKVKKIENEIPKATTIKVVMEISVINNRTEKEYVYKSENNFGLDWDTIGGWLHIKQNTNFEGEWVAVAALVDFSIVKCGWGTFDIC